MLVVSVGVITLTVVLAVVEGAVLVLALGVVVDVEVMIVVGMVLDF